MKDRFLLIALLAAGGFVLFQKQFRHHFHRGHAPSVAVASSERLQEKEVMIDKRFPAKAGEQLVVNIEHSDLVVETGTGNEAHVRVVLESTDMERAREYYKSLNFEVEDTPSGIRIAADRDGNKNWNWRSRDKISITAYVTVPQTFDYDIRMSHGDAKIPQTNGSASIVQSHGDLDLSGIRGENFQVKLSHGDLTAGTIEANDVSLSSSHGDMVVRSIKADRIDAKTAHGDVRIASVSGEISVDNSHGDISVRLDEHSGSRFSNSHGDIDIMAANGVRANVDFRGDGVRIASALAFEGSVKNKRAEGRINGGGAEMTARTSHGSITLRER